MVCAAYAANVLENALSTLGHEARERAFAQTDELLAEYSQWALWQEGVEQRHWRQPAPAHRRGVFCLLNVRCKTYTAKLSPATGNRQVERQGAPIRSRLRLPQRIHPS